MGHSPLDLSSFKDPLARTVAEQFDSQDELRHFQAEFAIPSKSDLKKKVLADQNGHAGPTDNSPCLYFCGNSLGVQPKRTREYINKYLNTWGSYGVHGHFKNFSDSVTASWKDIDEQAAAAMAPLVGASASEVAVMQTLTANLHFLLASFYRPSKDKFKIIIEAKAFPSDHFAVESHLRHHGYDPKDAMVLIEPDDVDKHRFSTKHICDTIASHADSTALVLLPGIQFYTGQVFDIPHITKFAHDRNLVIGWDLAHAAGNLPVQLHDWDVDFAAWCTYKYINSGPGCIGSLFVHSKHGSAKSPSPQFRNRLSGWWGSDKVSRFDMDNRFEAIEGAGGWQLSNPSALDITALLASLSIFNATSMTALRAKSLRLTAYLEHLLLNWPYAKAAERPFTLLTPSNPEERGAQISLRLNPGLLDGVMEDLDEAGVVLDERKPDVIRIAPTPLYNSFDNVWEIVQILFNSLEKRAP